MSRPQILIVEDEILVARNLQFRLQAMGYSIPAFVSSGEEVFQAVADSPPDLILMDIRLSGEMNGIQAAEQLEGRYDIPVVFLTAYADDATVQQAKAVKPFGYVLKPFREQELRVTIEMALYKHDLDRKLRRVNDELERHVQQLKWESSVNASMAALSQALITAATLDEISDLTLEHARRLTDSKLGCVGYIDSQTGSLLSTTLSSGIWDACQMADQEDVFREFSQLWSWVLQQRAPLIINQPDTDLHCCGIPNGQVAIHRFLAVPAIMNNDLVGQIALANADHPYGERDLEVVQRLASLYAVAVQQKRSEEKLRLQSAALEAAANAIVITDERGEINWVNPAFSRLTGYEIHEVIGDQPSVLKSGTHPPGFYADLWQTILAGNVWQSELVNRRKDGSLYHEEMTITPVRDPAGKVRHFIAIKQDITERKRAEKALQRYAEEQSMLYTVTSSASAFLDPNELLTKTIDVLAKAMNADRAWAILGEDIDGHTRRMFSSGSEPFISWEREISASLLAPDRLAAIQNLCTKCLSYITGDLHLEPVKVDVCPDLSDALPLQVAQNHYHLCIPLSVSNRILGILTLVWQNAASAPKTESKVLLTLGRQVGMALRNAQLYQAALQVDRLRILNRIGAAASSSLETDAVLDEILQITCQALNADEGAILLRDPSTDELVLEMTLSPDARLIRGQRLAPGQGIAGWVVQNRRSLNTSDGTAYPHGAHAADQPAMASTTSILCVPLIYRDDVKGVIELEKKHKSAFGDDDLSLLEAVASVAVTAIENARLFTATRLRAQELAALHDLGLSLAVTLDSSLVIANAILQLEKLFAADILALWEIDADDSELHLTHAIENSQPVKHPSLCLKSGEGLAGWVAQTRRPLLLAQMSENPNISVRIIEYTRLKDGSAMAAPLLRPDRLIGAIVVIKAELKAYTTQDLRLLESVSSTLAIALENAHLYENLKALLDAHQKTQAQLIQAEKISALGRLAALIAHEINNPLQAVQGCLALFNEEMAGRKRQEKLDRYLQIVGSEIDRVADIVGRMRDFYRPARQQTQPTDLHQVLESVLELTDKQLAHSNVEVECTWDVDLPVIQSNPDHLKQVFLNLVLNAIDALPDGGRLHVSTSLTTLQKPGQPKQPAVNIVFQDNGKGMSPEVQAKLFEPFFTTKEQGSGLGLYISYAIIASFGGQMSVTSYEGVGTTFTIVLPVQRFVRHELI